MPKKLANIPVGFEMVLVRRKLEVEKKWRKRAFESTWLLCID